MSTRQRDQLLAYVGLLLRWNTTYNLTAVRDVAGVVSNHLADCLATIGPLDRVATPGPLLRLLDVGSGAGLPGCIVAIMRPDVAVTCVDSVGKKVAFIRHAAGELSLKNLRGEHSRVEAMNARYDVVASRAFADLSEFISLTRHLLAPQGVWMAMKARLANDELVRVPAWAETFHVEQLNVPGLDAERCLVWARTRSPDKAPRDE